jgi:hypothetical protein
MTDQQIIEKLVEWLDDKIRKNDSDMEKCNKTVNFKKGTIYGQGVAYFNTKIFLETLKK